MAQIPMTLSELLVEFCKRTDRQTNIHTFTVLRTPPRTK